MPTRRTSRRTSRRAARALRSNARPIRVDPILVDDLMKKITVALKKFKTYATSREWELNDPLLRGGGIELFRFEITDVKGNAKKITASLYSMYPRPDFRGKFIDIRGMDVPPYARGQDGLIEIYITPESTREIGLDWSEIDSPDSLHNIKTTLEHELLHARDVLYGRVRKDDEDKLGNRDMYSDMFLEEYDIGTEYFLQKPELRAFMAAILSEIRERAAHTLRSSEHGDYSKAIARALDESPTWQSIRVYLSMRGKKLLFKGIVTALEDEGIITVR